MLSTLLTVWIAFGSVASAGSCRDGGACAAEARAAKDARHMGEHCSYATAAMIGRVLERGAPWRFDGELVSVADQGDAAFATPYRVVDAAGVEVVLLGNEVLDTALPATAVPPFRASLEGRLLESRGRRYAVVTAAAVR